MGKKLKITASIAGTILAGIVGWVAWVNLTYARDFSGTPLPKIEASADPKVIAEGAYLASAIAHCSACHGPGELARKHELPADPKDLRGGYVMNAGPFGTFYPSNLTSDPETGIAKLSDAEIARVVRHGVAPNGRLDPLMMIAVGPMADEDLGALIAFLRSLPPIKNAVPKDEWGFVAKALSGKFAPRTMSAPQYVPRGEPSRERGEYLANGPAACFSCHTPVDPTKGFAETGPRFSGAAGPEADHVDARQEVMAPNLTPDPETGVLGSFTEDTFIDRVRKVGFATRGSTMPWDNYKMMTDDDLKSIFRYLQSLPPTKHFTGPPRRPRGWRPDGR
jgi:mono/diheme cytochrome c family protein